MEVGSVTQPSYLPHLCVSDGSKSVEYNEKTMEEALKKVEKMDADLGGTEILEPLKHIYSQPCIPSQPRQVTHTHTHTHTHYAQGTVDVSVPRLCCCYLVI